MSRRFDDSKKGSGKMLNNPKVMEALNRLFEEAPMQYYSDATFDWVLNNAPDESNKELRRQWRLHMRRLIVKSAIKKLREDFARMLERILWEGLGATDIKIMWEEWYPTMTFKSNFKEMSARIVVDNRGAIGYEICVEGDGIFVDLPTKKVGYDPKLGDYNCVYNLFNYESLGELDPVLSALTKSCKDSPNIDECRREIIEDIRRELGWKRGGRA